MPKFMNMSNYFSALNLQLFADDGGDGAGDDDAGDGDDQDGDDDDPDKSGEDEPKYTQADLDKAIACTIAKERRKAERAAAKQKQKEKSGMSGDGEGDSDAEKAEEAAKTAKLEVKLACFEADVAKESVDDVAALAHAYMEADDSLDLEDAIEKVVKKYPHFKKNAAGADDDADEGTRGKSWGERQKGSGGNHLTGVEKAFLKKNPGLKY